jgi:hypothetical protein
MQTNRKNISPSRVDDKRTNFLTVRLVAAANSAHPAAEMLGREYSEWNGDEDTAQGDELVPAMICFSRDQCIKVFFTACDPHKLKALNQAAVLRFGPLIPIAPRIPR